MGILSPYVVNAREFNEGTKTKEEVSIKALDDYTLQIKTIGPTPFFLNLLSFVNLSPVLVDHIRAKGSDWDQRPEEYISNGPYKMSEIVLYEKIVIEKNIEYWNADAIKIEKITFHFLQANQDPITLYQDGIVDGIYEISPAQLRIHPEIENKIHTHIAPSTAFVVVNHRNQIGRAHV